MHKQLQYRICGFLLCSLAGCLLSSCSSQLKAKERHIVHKFEYGKTAYIGPDGKAQAPPRAPRRVKRMIEAANALTGHPYVYGGGHRNFYANGYDCSGAISHVLHVGGKLDAPLVSNGFFDYGKKGYGDWVTIYVRKGHVFMTIAGLRFDAGGTWNSTGPRWKPERRGARGYYVRHPSGL